ncbi:MAG: hypothetical protein WCF18_17805 [Chthoniobacteraceae bacterium]
MKGLNNPLVVFVGLVALIAAVMGIGLAWENHLQSANATPPPEIVPPAHPSAPPAKDTPPAESGDAICRAAVAYLAQPIASGREYAEQLLPGVHFDLFNLRSQQVFLSLPRRDDAPADYPAAAIARVVKDPASVRWAEAKQSTLTIDGLSTQRVPERWHVAATPVSNLKIDPAQVLHFPFHHAEYAASLAELADLIENRAIMGGMLHAEGDDAAGGSPETISNYGTVVVAPDEPSLQRLAKALAGGDGEPRELRIQRLLDFVAGEIRTDTTANSAAFPMKRPNETLMTRTGNAPQKAALFCSLLRGIGEEPLLVYYAGKADHVDAAVARGAFPLGGSVLPWRSGNWLVADCSQPRFQLGKSKSSVDQPRYVQPVAEPNTIYSLATGKTLRFRTR